MRSMTGYGIAKFNLNNIEFNFEIRAVNHRYCDINPKLNLITLKDLILE